MGSQTSQGMPACGFHNSVVGKMEIPTPEDSITQTEAAKASGFEGKDREDQQHRMRVALKARTEKTSSIEYELKRP